MFLRMAFFIGKNGSSCCSKGVFECCDNNLWWGLLDSVGRVSSSIKQGFIA